MGLKRLLGMLGHQIKESEKLSHDTSISTIGELYELLAYNVSDCLGLAQLFQHPAYASAFDLKAGLLTQYSETVYAKNGSVRRDRLTIDSSSAKFVGRILAPYTALNDIESVSFLYPAKEVADERGISQVNILDECVRFFEENVAPDPGKDAAATAGPGQGPSAVHAGCRLLPLDRGAELQRLRGVPGPVRPPGQVLARAAEGAEQRALLPPRCLTVAVFRDIQHGRHPRSGGGHDGL